MKIGKVTPDKEAVVDLIVQGINGQPLKISAVLDTGFTEYMTLPPEVIMFLGLPYRYSLPMYLADGNPIRVRIFEVTLDWMTQQSTIPVQETEGDILLGISLLYGFRLLVDVLDGGEIVLQTIA